MEALFLLTSLLMIIPIYAITIKECFPNISKTKYIVSLLFNPTFIYILSVFIQDFFINILKIKSTPHLELMIILISILICLGIFILLFDKEKKNLGMDCFIYISFILIEFTSISTLLLNYSIIEAFLSCIVLPFFTYIMYYFIITKNLKIIMEELRGFDAIILNILPCLASILVLSISLIGNVYIDKTNLELVHRYSIFSIFINYLLLVFEFISYYIIFNNANKQYNLKEINKQIIKNQEQVIGAFSKVIENSNEKTGNHVKRVSEYTYILAKALGYGEKESNNIRIASMLHDIGKVYIPNTILEKPDKLTNEEFEIIKSHVTKGEQLLHGIDGELMNLAKIIALEHHEKWNGNGYLGIKGENIHLESRIVAVADVFDALVSKRSYKESWSLEKAYDLIVSENGSHFDPLVVNAFKNHFDEISQIYYKLSN